MYSLILISIVYEYSIYVLFVQKLQRLFPKNFKEMFKPM